MEMARYGEMDKKKQMLFRYPLEDMEENRRYFDEVSDLLLSREKEKNGFGTLQEKTIHEVVKDFYCYDHDFQEQKKGRYIADIAIGNEIWEVQTRAFDRLRPKLDAFLPENHVTVIYPVSVEKRVYWLEEETGTITGGRRSPKKGTPYDVFRELYKIRPYLQNLNLSVHIFLMDMEEYRLLNGWSRDKKRGSTRYDRLPGKLRDIVRLERKEDYGYFLPGKLPEYFTSKDLTSKAHITMQQAGQCLLILRDLGLIEMCGKRGRCNLYFRVQRTKYANKDIII